MKEVILNNMEKRKQYIEETAEKETVRLFNNSLLHPEFKYGFILGMTHADKVPFIKNHKEYDTICKYFLDKACKYLQDDLRETSDRDGYPSVESRSCVSVKEFINSFIKAMTDE